MLPGIIGAAAVFVAVASQGQIDAVLSIPPGAVPLTPSELPKVGNYYFLVNPSPRVDSPPLPCPPPPEYGWPVYALGGDNFLMDNSADAPALPMTAANGSFGPMDDPVPQGGGAGGGSSGPCPGFAQEVFSLLDTNDVASVDTNLYNELVLFPPDTSAGPNLQIMLYQKNVILIKANHFDYSADTRDFGLVICDSPTLPLWRNFNVSPPQNAQDGWLLAGTVPNGTVADPMYLEVSNAPMTCDEFFMAIPYAGPQVLLSGPQPYATVSNIVTLQATIADLSGVNPTNEIFVVTVNGLPARYFLGTSNLISLDTRYAPSGIQEIEAAADSIPVTYDPQMPPLDAPVEYASSATLQLDFENHAFIVNDGDMCSPDVGTNVIVFGLNDPDSFTAQISDPTGNVVASYAGSAPAGNISLLWNFTEADGVTPYTNSNYIVSFVANDPDGLKITNSIEGDGVRPASGVIITYGYEDPSTPQGVILNGQSDSYVGQTLAFLYQDIYDPWGLTQYTPDYGLITDIWFGRNLTSGAVDPFGPNPAWRPWLQQALGSPLYSDLTIGPIHGNPRLVATLSPTNAPASTADFYGWCHGIAGKNWRMRKVAMWSCRSVVVGKPWPYPSNIPTFPDAFGIYPKPIQDNHLVWKNAGLFWGEGLSQAWFYPGGIGQTTAQAEEAFDEYWVTGPRAYPGGCDPTYAIYHSVQKLE
jgi:hypothetical protein